MLRTSKRTLLVALAIGLAAPLLAACEPLPVPGLASGATLASGSTITSANGAFSLTNQVDGNVVLREVSSRKVLWQTGTTNRAGAKLQMRTNGQLSVITTGGSAVWSTSTWSAGSVLELGDDGNLIIRALPGQPVWASGSSAASGARVPASQRTTSSQGKVFIQLFEGYVGDAPYHDSNGNCTVGYGHLIRLGACTAADRAKTYDVEALFSADVIEHENRLKRTLGSVPMNQREFDALSSYTFHRGSLSATSAPNLYAAMAASPPRYADVPQILRDAGDASVLGICHRRYDEADLFAGGRYDRNVHCS